MMKVMFSLIQKIFQTNSFHKYSPGQIQILSLSISLITVGLELSRSEHVYIPASIDGRERILHLEKPHLKNSKRLQNDQVPFLRQVLLLLHLKVRIAFCFAQNCCENHSSHHQHCQPTNSICIYKPTSFYYELKNKKEAEQRDSGLITVTDTISMTT